MIRKPQYKVARRLGEKIYPKTQTQKFALRVGRKVPKGNRRPGSKTEYGQQFLEKQKVKFSYGVMEKQFARYVREAREGQTNPAQNLYARLETRLDNVVYRMGLASTRTAARQMVSHGHICINGKRVTVPSYQVHPGTKVTIREGSKSKAIFRDLDARLKNYKSPDWMTFDAATTTGMVRAVPSTIQQELSLNFNAVLELYSRS